MAACITLDELIEQLTELRDHVDDDLGEGHGAGSLPVLVHYQQSYPLVGIPSTATVVWHEDCTGDRLLTVAIGLSEPGYRWNPYGSPEAWEGYQGISDDSEEDEDWDEPTPEDSDYDLKGLKEAWEKGR